MIDKPTRWDHYGNNYLTPITGIFGIRGFHPGEDLNFGPSPNYDLGQDVRSFGVGKVVFVSNWVNPGWGRVVVIEHQFINHLGENVTVWGRYAHLLDIKVKKGDGVNWNTVIGHVGKSGTTSPHLHFDVFKTNPVPFYLQYVWGRSIASVKAQYANIDFICANWKHV